MEFNDDNKALTMLDEEGNELGYNVLATKEDEAGCFYMLVEEDAGEEAIESEVLIFKCTNYANFNTAAGLDDADLEDIDEEMIFEQLDEDHADFERAFDLFKEDFEALGVELGNDED